MRLSLATRKQDHFPDRTTRMLLIGLMMPLMMRVIDISMFRVALPTIRQDFGIPADVTAWLDTVYTVPFIIFMPLYGRLGDGVEKFQLFLTGITVFLIGTVVTLSAIDLRFLIVGRILQGMGAAEIHPLSLSIISERIPLEKRGSALGTWSSSGALIGMVGPLGGGILIALWGWRMIFGPVLLIGGIALLVVQKQARSIPQKVIQKSFLRTFDWGGVLLLSTSTIVLVFYASSRPITGVAALQDWRLFILALLLFGGFLIQEMRHPNPFVALDIFTNKNFSLASIGAGIRKFAVNSVDFLIPLYLIDIHRLNIATVGGIMTFQSVAILTTMRVGGQLADRWGSRWPVVIGSLIQSGMMVYFAVLSDTAPLVWIILGLTGHGLGAGLTLAALDRSSIATIPLEKRGVAAGLYQMICFSGVALGVALEGVLLQYGLERTTVTIAAYQLVFWCIAGVVFLGVISAWGVEK